MDKPIEFELTMTYGEMSKVPWGIPRSGVCYGPNNISWVWSSRGGVFVGCTAAVGLQVRDATLTVERRRREVVAAETLLVAAEGALDDLLVGLGLVAASTTLDAPDAEEPGGHAAA
jgi:hypothetical protein